MIFIPPTSTEVGGEDYRVPLQQDGKTPDTSGFALIPNVNEKVAHTFKFNMVGELHFVPVDRAFLTVDLLTRANLNRLDTYPTTANQLKQIACAPDLWTTGAYLRSRELSDLVNRSLRRVPIVGTLCIVPFVGFFGATPASRWET